MAVLNNIQILAKNPDAILVPAMQQAVLLVERSAKQKAPRDTGELTGSITSQVDINADGTVSGTVGTNKVYAP